MPHQHQSSSSSSSPPQGQGQGRSTRSSIKRFYNSSLEEELDLVGKTSYNKPSGLQTPTHFMSEDSPNKFLDLNLLNTTPDKNKVHFSLQETAPLSFDCVLDHPVTHSHCDPPPLNDYSFSGLMEHMMDGDLSTPQPSPLSPPYSNETLNPYTPFTEEDTESGPPPTPQSQSPFPPDPKEKDDTTVPSSVSVSLNKKTLRKRKADPKTDVGNVKKKSKITNTRKRKKSLSSSPSKSTSVKEKNSFEEIIHEEITHEEIVHDDTLEDDFVAPTPTKVRRKSPIKELRMFPRVEMPSTPEVCIK